MKKLFLFFFITIQFSVYAQSEYAWVYFTDKANVAYALAHPNTILTQEAINRKSLHNIPIDARDVPVNPAYVSQIKTQSGITVYASSKWFNCVFVSGTKNKIDLLKNFSFVDSIDFADHSLNKAARPVERERRKYQGKWLHERTNFNYGYANNQVQMINVDYLHQQGYTGEGVSIAILDAGFPNVDSMAAFQRMRNNNDLLDGYDFVADIDNEFAFTGSWHGTMVLSSISGYLQNQFVGTAPDVSVYLFRTENVASETPEEMAYWVEAAERADSLGVDIISTSLGYSLFDDPDYSFQPSDMDGQTTFISRGANIAFEKGMLVVCSAGNSGNNPWGIITAPADAAGVFSIGAVDSIGSYAPFSSTGPTADGRIKPDVVAQGMNTTLITPTGNIVLSSGTSFSCPIIAGAIACLWQANPGKTNAEIMQAVRQSASLYNNPNYQLGYGIPDFQAALSLVLSIDSTEKNEIIVYPNPVGNTLYLKTFDEQGRGSIRIFSVLGRRIKQLTVEEFPVKIDVSNLSRGVYFMKLSFEGYTSTRKIIKK